MRNSHRLKQRGECTEALVGHARGQKLMYKLHGTDLVDKGVEGDSRQFLYWTAT